MNKYASASLSLLERSKRRTLAGVRDRESYERAVAIAPSRQEQTEAMGRGRSTASVRWRVRDVEGIEKEVSERVFGGTAMLLFIVVVFVTRHWLNSQGNVGISEMEEAVTDCNIC